MSNFWAYRNLLNNQYADFINDVSRLANELQEQFPEMSRTHALKEAERLVGNYGIGISLGKESVK